MDPAARRRQRREVLDNARRTVERSLSAAGPAEELAEAAGLVLEAAATERLRPDHPALARLRDGLSRYRRATGGTPRA